MTGCTEQQVSLRNMVRQRMSHFSPQQQTEQQVFPKDTTMEQQDSHYSPWKVGIGEVACNTGCYR